MIRNLFSIFDPSTRFGARGNWLVLFLRLILFPKIKWRINSRWRISQTILIGSLLKEIKLLLPRTRLRGVFLFLSLFYLIVWNNRVGLSPYVFTPTRHLAVTLRLALPLWLGYFSYGWICKTKWILAHLVPQGTPSVLIPFMVLIERLRTLIRPGTLSIRLAANIIAGHLLLTLIRGAVRVFSPLIGLGIIRIQILLVILEVAVAFVQSYVLVVLRVLYAREI